MNDYYGTPGNRIFTEFERPSPKRLEKFRGIPSSNIGDCMSRLFCMRGLRPLNQAPLLGPAFTVRVPQGDNLMFHYAIQAAQPGDILVVDGEGDMEHALAGEMMLNESVRRKLGGWVVDGCLRDVAALSQAEQFPIYCRGITPQGPYKNGPGEVGVPASCGGQVVFPGDILAGDADGIVVIHAWDAEAVVDEARKKFVSEEERKRSKEPGQTDWVQMARQCVNGHVLNMRGYQ